MRVNHSNLIYTRSRIFRTRAMCWSTSSAVAEIESVALHLCEQTYHVSFICELAHPFRQDLVDVPVFLKEAGFFLAPGHHNRIY